MDIGLLLRCAVAGLMMLLPSTLWCQGTQTAPNQPLPIETFLSLIGSVTSAHPILIDHGFILKERKTVQGPDGKMILSYRYRLNHSHNPQTNLYEFDSFDLTDSLFYFQYSTSSKTNSDLYRVALLREFQRQRDMINANKDSGVHARIEHADSDRYRFIITAQPLYHPGMGERKPMETVYRIETGKEFYEDTPNYMIKVFLGAMTTDPDKQ